MSSSTPSTPLPPEAWPRAHQAARRILYPITRLLHIEAASGIVLILATVVALVWANTIWHQSYHDLWHTPLGISLGPWQFERDLHFWVNDGLMTIFFLVVGLEIRREMFEGELSDLRRASLPVVAAVGGMLVPAGIFVALNAGRAGSAGWAIPMATDIAFAVGILTLLGNRASPALRILLLALAVIDDIGAILVIAIFYSAGVAPDGLLIAAGGIASCLAFRGLAVRNPLVYLAPGVLVWAGLYSAGIHPTLAGVILGLLTPVQPWAGREAHSPSAALQELLHGWVAFVIMPLFALANAGVALGGASLEGDAFYLFVGIVAGLAIGKPLGVFVLSRGAIGVRMAVQPRDCSTGGLLIVGVVAGIGFTMSLFIAQLAFPPGPMLETAKLAILVGSAIGAVGGLVLGLLLLRPQVAVASAEEAEASTEL
jgi:Na+:H+ antiporter, NhaA family